jgi:hypothetical protein
MGLWDEFREYLIREEVVSDKADAEAYMAVYLHRDEYDFEFIADELWHFAGFLEEQFRKRFGEDAVRGLWFLEHVDSDYKYNEVRVVKDVTIGKYEYEVVVNVYDCKWGEVAESPEDFNEQVDSFLNKTKEKLDNLLQNVK